jgi:hypothetical protein
MKMQMDNGKVFTMKARNLSEATKVYPVSEIKRETVEKIRYYLRRDQKRGELEFEMTAKKFRIFLNSGPSRKDRQIAETL